MSTPDPRRWAPRRCSGPTSALTVGELSAQWPDIGERSPILVMHDASVARWVEHADVFVAEDSGLVVARLWAPYAKLAEPPPGTVWPWQPRPIGNADPDLPRS